MQTYSYGFPKLGKNREFKKLTENFWNKKIEEAEFKEEIKKIEENIISTYGEYVDKFPVGEMSLYDNMLDTAIMVGAYNFKDLNGYYDLCRGKKALELTKWFNTNYHYLVPELNSPAFKVNWNKAKEKKDIFKKGIPYFIGPFTFLKLSKGVKRDEFKGLLLSLIDVYLELIKGMDEVHFDEPAFVMDSSKEDIAAIKEAYGKFKNSQVKINIFTYYDNVDFLKDLYELPVAGIGLDFVNGKENLENIKRCGFPEDKTLIAGVVNGRNIWRADIIKQVNLLKELSQHAKNIIISNAAPLSHLPLTIEGEDLDKRLLGKISFAGERLYELKLIARAFEGDMSGVEDWNKAAADIGFNEEVKNRVKLLKDEDFIKPLSYNERVKLQKEALNLPLFPTTTIGSFPQDKDVRSKRAAFTKGLISKDEYKSFIREKIKDLVSLQEDLGLDVLVHGEFERTDMVEFFAQKLEGIATTKNGWIVSYGTRGYRPPVIYGDVSRPNPMTIEEISYAQSLSKHTVKGMLTGPVTIISWSYVRNDVPVSEVAYQIGLCLQDEIKDYEKAGIKIVQIDEPAFREKAPIKKDKWPAYFDWAVKSFNLSAISRPETQIHTHMCYSEFGEIINYISEMDFDVITIEASRSKGDIIKDFKKIDFKKQIGLGVWDIHSPAVPTSEEMEEIVKSALEVLSKENFWINPDCGLKTRKWEESKASLRNLVELAKKLRKNEN